MMIKTQPSIRTRFLGPTDTKDPRISVADDSRRGRRRRSVFSWKEGEGVGENHRLAAQAWLDIHNPGAKVVTPGLGFDVDFHWAWEF